MNSGIKKAILEGNEKSAQGALDCLWDVDALYDIYIAIRKTNPNRAAMVSRRIDQILDSKKK